MNPKIKEVLVDLKYRGDLLPRSTKAGQKALKAAVEANNLKKFKEVRKIVGITSMNTVKIVLFFPQMAVDFQQKALTEITMGEKGMLFGDFCQRKVKFR